VYVVEMVKSPFPVYSEAVINSQNVNFERSIIKRKAGGFCLFCSRMSTFLSGGPDCVGNEIIVCTARVTH